jgi:hypothetical protein
MTRLLLRLRVRDENDEHEMLTVPNAKFEVMYIIPTRASMKSVVLKHLRHTIFMTNFQSLPNLLIYYSMKNKLFKIHLLSKGKQLGKESFSYYYDTLVRN